MSSNLFPLQTENSLNETRNMNLGMMQKASYQDPKTTNRNMYTTTNQLPNPTSKVCFYKHFQQQCFTTAVYSDNHLLKQAFTISCESLHTWGAIMGGDDAVSNIHKTRLSYSPTPSPTILQIGSESYPLEWRLYSICVQLEVGTNKCFKIFQ